MEIIIFSVLIWSWPFCLTGVSGGVFDAAVVRRVVSGSVISRGEWPFLVSLQFKKSVPYTEKSKMKHVCGGTIIDPLWVITAAHCVSAELRQDLGQSANWDVVLGEHNQYLEDEGEQHIEIDTIIAHPGFDFNRTKILRNDVALIKLKTPVMMSQYVGIMGLNEEPALPPGMECEVAGWGQLSPEPFGWGMYIPVKATVDVISTKKCGENYENYGKGEGYTLAIDENTVCAGLRRPEGAIVEEELNQDACYGDSGGPLICPSGPEGEKRLAGIVSGGKECGLASYPGIYTRVSAFLYWLQENMDDK